MTSKARDWRKAMPKWATEQAEAEMAAYRLAAALAWPSEAKPEPLPFQFGEYDREICAPGCAGVQPGTYWSINRSKPVCVVIRKRIAGDGGLAWRSWRFSVDGGDFRDTVFRGPLYASKREAALAVLWRRCEEVAPSLAHLRDSIARATAEAAQEGE